MLNCCRCSCSTTGPGPCCCHSASSAAAARASSFCVCPDQLLRVVLREQLPSAEPAAAAVAGPGCVRVVTMHPGGSRYRGKQPCCGTGGCWCTG
jgi:hypothetical protein